MAGPFNHLLSVCARSYPLERIVMPIPSVSAPPALGLLVCTWAVLISFSLDCAGIASTDSDAPSAVVHPFADYTLATQKAQQLHALLLVSVEPSTAESPADRLADDAVGQWLGRLDVQQRFASSEKPWIFCRIGSNETVSVGSQQVRLIDHPSLVELRHGPGIFVVDYAHEAAGLHGRIVSIVPRTAGKYYRFSPAHIDELATLPAGTLTQRSMMLAVRIHPERPLSVYGKQEPILANEAAAHSLYQALICQQGHHNWQTRSERIAGKLGGVCPTEVCAESWPRQDLLDSCVDCVASWRQSAGHWNAVKSPQVAFGYDIRRGKNGIWYATGIFTR